MSFITRHRAPIFILSLCAVLSIGEQLQQLTLMAEAHHAE